MNKKIITIQNCSFLHVLMATCRKWDILNSKNQCQRAAQVISLFMSFAVLGASQTSSVSTINFKAYWLLLVVSWSHHSRSFQEENKVPIGC